MISARAWPRSEPGAKSSEEVVVSMRDACSARRAEASTVLQFWISRRVDEERVVKAASWASFCPTNDCIDAMLLQKSIKYYKKRRGRKVSYLPGVLATSNGELVLQPPPQGCILF